MPKQKNKYGSHNPRPLPPKEELEKVLAYNSQTGDFLWRKSRTGVAAMSLAGSINYQGYREIKVFGKKRGASRLAWMMYYGEDPGKLQIDHINHITGDNRIENLRKVTPAQNQRNAKVQDKNTSGVKGVTYQPRYNKWGANVGGKLEYFQTRIEAIARRQEIENLLKFPLQKCPACTGLNLLKLNPDTCLGCCASPCNSMK